MLWTKVIYFLSTISDTVRLHITEDRVKISSLNTTKTSLLSVSFNSKRFFESFNLQDDISILVNSKPLALIFRNYRLGNEEVDFFRFTINQSSTIVRKLNRSRNKLFIEIMAKDNLKKSYSLNFVRCKESFDLKVDSKYKESLLTQSDDHSLRDRIHYLMIETSILKNFLDMFPPSIEDFKIEVMKLSRRLNLIGFNKQQLLTGSKGNTTKESRALRKPMSLTVGLSLNDLLGDNFPDDEQTDQEKLNVVFRLRDFKTYINLINSISFSTILSKNTDNGPVQNAQLSHQQNQQQQHLRNFVEILFNTPGLPLLLSRRCELPNSYSAKQITNTLDNSNEEFELFKIELILITDSEGGNINIEENDLVIPNVQILQNDIDTADVDRGTLEPSKRPHESLFVPEDDHDEVLRKKKPAAAVQNNRRKFNLQPLLNESNPAASQGLFQQYTQEGQVEQSVLWNDPGPMTASASVQTSEFIILNRANDMFNSRNNPLEETEDLQEPEEMALGPTQGVYKVKGLFD